MKKLSIIRSDNTVCIDGRGLSVDCSALPAYIRAVQWDEEHQSGWIEFVNDGHGVFRPNQKIVERTTVDHLVEAWQAKALEIAGAVKRAADQVATEVDA